MRWHGSIEGSVAGDTPDPAVAGPGSTGRVRQGGRPGQFRFPQDAGMGVNPADGGEPVPNRRLSVQEVDRDLAEDLP